MDYLHAKTGRPPKKAEPGTKTTLTIRIPAEIKNLMVDQAVAFDMTLTEYIIALVERDVT
jgi:hypothetical protein